MAAPRRDWLHTIPPLRFKPRTIRTRRHHTSLRHAYHEPVETSIVAGLNIFAAMFVLGYLLFAWEIALLLWVSEFEIWLAVWSYYGLFLAARWIWRNNPIGRAIDSAHRARLRRRPTPYDPHAAPPRPVDLAQLGTDPWDTAPMRRRG